MSTETEKILNGVLSKNNPHFWTDIDGTLKHSNADIFPDKFNPEVVGVLLALQELAGLGASTEQSPYELQPFLAAMQKYAPEGQYILTGPSVLEGGHVSVPVGGIVGEQFTILTSPEALDEMQQILAIFTSHWHAGANDGHAEWGLLPGIPTPVVLAGGKYQRVGSISIWENGPDIHDTSYQGEYEFVMQWFQSQAKQLNLSHLDFLEAGNGTLRIIERGTSKATLLQALHQQGAVDLGACVYMGDGPNDVAPAAVVKAHGGIVIAVANAHPELKKLADIVTNESVSDGVLEILKPIT